MSFPFAHLVPQAPYHNICHCGLQLSSRQLLISVPWVTGSPMRVGTAVHFVHCAITNICTVLALSKYSGYSPLLRERMKTGGAEHERNRMFLPLSVCHLNSLKILLIISARISIARKVLSHHSNSVASRKGLFCTFIYEFMSLRGSVTSFSRVTSKFMPLNMSLLCAHQILKKKE